MGRGVSAGGGQSSLGYLFGSGETTNSPQPATTEKHVKEPVNVPLQKSASAPASADAPPKVSTSIPEPLNFGKQSSSGAQDTKKNNYFRADGQNCGNFITDHPSTKVHAAPGGGSSLGYLFGDGSKCCPLRNEKKHNTSGK